MYVREVIDKFGEGPFTDFLNKLDENEEKEEEEYFTKAKSKLNEDLVLIPNKLEKIKTFKKYKDLNYEYENNNKKIDKKNHSECFLVFANIICGLFFPLFQLIGVQEQLIVLNSLLNELIEEFRLAIKDTPRQYNFYEVIKICSFKEIPNMEISILTSFIGIAAMKNLGYFWTNFCFQLLPGLMFFFIFLLFFLPYRKRIRRKLYFIRNYYSCSDHDIRIYFSWWIFNNILKTNKYIV